MTCSGHKAHSSPALLPPSPGRKTREPEESPALASQSCNSFLHLPFFHELEIREGREGPAGHIWFLPTGANEARAAGPTQLCGGGGEAKGRCFAGTLFLEFQFIHTETEVETKHRSRPVMKSSSDPFHTLATQNYRNNGSRDSGCESIPLPSCSLWRAQCRDRRLTWGLC